MLDFVLLLLAGTCLGLAAWLGLRGRAPGALLVGAPPAGARPTPAAADAARSFVGSEPGWLRTVDAASLLECLHAGITLDHMVRQSRLSQQTWARDLRPAIDRYAEFVQLYPASESHHHAHAGGLLAHTLEAVLAAMTWRNGTLLPQGATAEVVDAQRDHWTYVVFYATLLHDIGKPLTDLRITWRTPGGREALRWLPIAGSLVDCKAGEYHVAFTPTAERDYGAHSRAAIQMLQRIAPTSALKFLAAEPSALEALVTYLQGEDTGSAVAQLVGRADQASARRAIASGSRARFDSAMRRPLIEVMMGALRQLLQRGGELPLNRDGAIGWIYDGSAWFVAKRLADLVRDHVTRTTPDESFPGPDRNDRLFDTWQEYGCITANPATRQAIWRVVVHGDDGDGYQHELTMLRFPLEKLWGDPARYPAPMAGRIDVSSRGSGSARAGTSAETVAGAAAERSARARADSSTGMREGSASGAAQRTPDADPQRASGARSTADALPLRSPTFHVPRPTGGAHLEAASTPLNGSPSRSQQSAERTDAAAPTTNGSGAEPSRQSDDSDLLDDESSASGEARRRGAKMMAQATTTAQLRPVVMPPAIPRLPGADRAGKEPSEVAIAFAQWLQAGLASGELRYNASGAPVHFVQAGMALVSPAIFRQFALSRPSPNEAVPQPPERVGLDVQREVLRAGWHVPAGEGINIHTFAVLKRGKARSGKLSAVVIANPEQWVLPVPPPNQALTPFDPASTEELDER